MINKNKRRTTKKKELITNEIQKKKKKKKEFCLVPVLNNNHGGRSEWGPSCGHGARGRLEEGTGKAETERKNEEASC